MTPIRILVVDDNALFAEMVTRLITPIMNAFPGSVVTIVGDMYAAEKELALIPGYDATFLDLTFHDSSMKDTLGRLDALESKTAVVIVTGQPEHRVREIIGDRPTPIIEKQPMLHRHAEVFMRKMLEAFDNAMNAGRNNRWAKIEENLQIMRSVIQNHATQT